MLNRRKYLKKSNMLKVDPSKLKIHNHLENNYVIGNKKALFHTMNKYYKLTKQNIFDYLPTTFHIESGLDDPTYMRFLNSFYEKAKRLKRQ
jgi:tubulin polyglutamylase TTLL1